MEKPKNTCIDFVFEDGDSVKLTVAFYALYQLRPVNKGLYDRFNKIMTKGMNDVLDMITVLYTAYMCANVADVSSCMSEEDFLIKCGSDVEGVKNAVQQLMSPKKQ